MQYYKIIAYAILIYYFAISRNYHPISFRLFLEHVFCKVDWTSFLIFVFNVGILIGKKALVSELTSWNWIFLILEHENSNSSKRDSRKIVTKIQWIYIYIYLREHGMKNDCYIDHDRCWQSDDYSICALSSRHLCTRTYHIIFHGEENTPLSSARQTRNSPISSTYLFPATRRMCMFFDV